MARGELGPPEFLARTPELLSKSNLHTMQATP
jgi:hypothetical protein